MNNLFKVNQKILDALNKIDFETGEWLGEKELELLNIEREQLLIELALDIKNLEAEKLAIVNLIKDFENRLLDLDKKVTRNNNIILKNLKEDEKIQDSRIGNIYKSSSKRVIIIDKSKLPAQVLRFIPSEHEPDKNLIKKLFNQNKLVAGAELETHWKVNIK